MNEILMYVLFAVCGLAGVAAHILTEIDKLIKSDKGFKKSAYIAREWASISLSILLVFAILPSYNYMKSVHNLGMLFNGFMLLWGYTNQSIFKKLVAAFTKKAGKVIGDGEGK